MSKTEYSIVTQVEAERGCGFRKPDKTGVGIYLTGSGLWMACSRLPYRLSTCPCCGAGVKPSRGWLWFVPRQLIGIPTLSECSDALCFTCKMGKGMPEGRHGLITVGEAFYATPKAYMDEAMERGISRKLPCIPKGFRLGETVVYLAHRKACPPVAATPTLFALEPEEAEEPEEAQFGIFSSFLPTGIDLVVDSDDPAQLPERAKNIYDALNKDLGEDAVDDEGNPKVRLIKVVPLKQQPDLFQV